MADASTSSSMTVHQHFKQQMERTPEAQALRDGDEVVTYAELWHRSGRLAAALAGRGVRPGDFVGICLPRSADLVVALLAVLRTGAAYLPLDPEAPAARQALILQDAAARLVVCSPDLARRLPEDTPRYALSEVPDTTDPYIDPETTGADLVYLTYTSGSTGRPKGVPVCHHSLLNLVLNADWVELDDRRRVLLMTPLTFDVSAFEIWGALLNGACLVVAPPGPVPTAKLGRILERHRVTTLWLTASHLHRVVEDDVTALDPVDQLLTGGDAPSASRVLRVLRARAGRRVVNCYGPTEATVFAAVHPCGGEQDVTDPLPIGRAVSGVQLRVVAPDGTQAAWNEPGELWIGGAGVAAGYWNRPDLTASRFTAPPGADPAVGWYRTGDRARVLPDGNIVFLGRIDDQVKVRGQRIEPAEIEHALLAHPAVRQAAVIAVPAPLGDRRLAAFVVGDDESCDPAELRGHLAERLPAAMIPATVDWLSAMPIGHSGKLDKAALAGLVSGPERQGPAGPQEPANPLDPRSVIRAIWAEALGVPEVPDSAGFLDLGGDSLGAIAVASRVLAVFGVDVELWDILDAEGVKAFADHVEQLCRSGR